MNADHLLPISIQRVNSPSKRFPTYDISIYIIRVASQGGNLLVRKSFARKPFSPNFLPSSSTPFTERNRINMFPTNPTSPYSNDTSSYSRRCPNHCIETGILFLFMIGQRASECREEPEDLQPSSHKMTARENLLSQLAFPRQPLQLQQSHYT